MKYDKHNSKKSRKLKSKKYKIQRKTRSRVHLGKINQGGGAGFHIDITDDEDYLYITDKLDDANHYLYKIDLRNKTFQINKMQDNEYYPLSQMPQRLRDIIFKARDNEDRRIAFILNAHKINPDLLFPRATVAPTVVENQPGRFYEKYFPPNGQHPYYVPIQPPLVLSLLPRDAVLPPIAELPSPKSSSSSRKSSSSHQKPSSKTQSPRELSPREPSPKALSSSKSSSRKSLASSQKPSSEALGRVTPLKVTEKLKAAIDFSRNRKLPPIPMEEMMRGSPYLSKLQRPSRGTIKKPIKPQ